MSRFERDIALANDAAHIVHLIGARACGCRDRAGRQPVDVFKCHHCACVGTGHRRCVDAKRMGACTRSRRDPLALLRCRLERRHGGCGCCARGLRLADPFGNRWGDSGRLLATQLCEHGANGNVGSRFHQQLFYCARSEDFHVDDALVRLDLRNDVAAVHRVAGFDLPRDQRAGLHVRPK